MDTMTKGCVYVTVTKKNELKAITLYDKNNKRYKQIDLSGNKHNIDGNKALPHSHRGYIQDEHGTKIPSKSENAQTDMVKSA